MIDNFELVKPMLKFDSDDDFYFIQILQRKKENPNVVNGSNNSRLINAYFINSVEHLDVFKDEMIFFANYFNARVGINLNKRSYEKTAFNTLKKTAEIMYNKNYQMVKRAWNTSCGIHNGCDKIWLLDIDTKDADFLNNVKTFVQAQKPIGDNVLGVIPSKAGFHLITKGFDLRDFNKEYPEIEVHKNNPTNLYIP